MQTLAPLAAPALLPLATADGAAAAAGVAPATRFLARPEGRIAYDLRGAAGPLVVCLPSMGDLRGEYRLLAPRLLAAGYRVATMDLRGLGESDAGFTDFSAAAVGSDLAALLREPGLLAPGERALIIGTSMAAGAAAWAAAEEPARVAGLVLVGPFVRDVPVSGLVTLAMRAMMLPPWGRAAWMSYYRTLYPKAKPADFPAYTAALRHNLGEPGRFAALRRMAFASKAACEARLPEVQAPTLVVMGSADPDFTDPGAEARLVAERLRGRAVMIEGAGHYPHAEVPEETAAVVLEFFGRLGRGEQRLG